ncbi:CPXCG motif-containing cysteine-rich protein [Planctomicrobium piriforme]|uniref:Cysteine-rich CPXCG n=1 Tax=Planctomicrobium piriforme TaxID=1576369 RepID=A0A1I3IK78_9PLAN|nr:CPXCG motif-containing cysteine-rich protein [Planctomicrobium piriforme]SFI48366.1 Cysteine-rich CPXCG [Planctomicrobium piriforme]
MQEETQYTCPYCGEEVVIPVDVTEGEQQEYVEDCPVCCSPVVLRIEFNEDGSVSCEASAEG